MLDGVCVSPILSLAACHATRTDTGRQVQCRVAVVEERGATGLDAALPSGGMKTGTTSAERIIKTATPTKTSTTEKRHFRSWEFIRFALFLSPRQGAL
jgi:hypothetical protein